MQDLLVVWDAIFADSVGFELVDFIFVAMLLYLREACKFSRSNSTLFQKTLWSLLFCCCCCYNEHPGHSIVHSAEVFC